MSVFGSTRKNEVPRYLLEYAFDVMCKHEKENLSDRGQGDDRSWCTRCQHWITPNDFTIIKRIEKTLTGTLKKKAIVK